MLINRAGLVWIGRRRPKWVDDRSSFIWQMPQGGMMHKESPEAAALRELKEETGVRSVDVLAATPDWLTYDLPQDLVGIALKGRYRGQRQMWFAMRFTGADSEVRIKPPRRLKAEFDAWRWAYASEAAELVIPYKRELYEQVSRAFAPYIAEAAEAPRPRAPSSWSLRLWKRIRASAYG